MCCPDYSVILFKRAKLRLLRTEKPFFSEYLILRKECFERKEPYFVLTAKIPWLKADYMNNNVLRFLLNMAVMNSHHFLGFSGPLLHEEDKSRLF
jgi:hypothetical protein